MAEERRSVWHKSEKVMASVVVAVAINIIVSVYNASFLLKNLDTVPPIYERITRNEWLINKLIEDKVDKKHQFTTVIMKVDQLRVDINKRLDVIREESAKDRVKAAKQEVKIKNSEERIREIHEYKYAPKSKR